LPQSAGSDRQERDTSGPYVVTNEDILTGKDGEKIAQVRTFLWEHWSKRKLGHMELTLFSKEGTASNISYEVEPDQSGRWSLKVTIERPTLKGTTMEHAQYRAYSIKRIASRHDEKPTHLFVPEKEERTGDQYRLAFYDTKNKKIGGV